MKHILILDDEKAVQILLHAAEPVAIETSQS